MAAEKSVQITVKVDPRLVERADSLLDKVSAETGVAASRADVYRLALIRGLQSLEAEERAEKKRAERDAD